MEEIKVAVIAHGLGMSRGYSGEGYVYKNIFELLKEKNINFVAVSFSKPYDTSLNSIYSLPFHLPKFDKYQRLLVYFTAKKVKPKLFFNASGILIPLSNIAPHIIYAGAPAISSVPSKYTRSLFWRLYLLPFRIIISRIKDEAKKATIIANSLYSARAIAKVFEIPQPQVIYPPVDVEFYSKAFENEDRESVFVTIARFEKGKMIENAIKFSHLSGIKGIVIGSLNDKRYYKELMRLRDRLNADIKFLPNLPREEVLKILSKAKLYFHPTIGEHFGIPIIEAMASGVVPIVPKESGGSEIVPQFSYDNLEDAVRIGKEIIEKYSNNLRKEMHEKAIMFDKNNFKEKIYDVISKYLM
ncbi:glycosyltransferase family 4 protein [Sulfurisphaera tokodaii]|uniref:Glycosyltransferase n=2 Tax=Sulfurisphaera tokodaii TaxID=111955 RepID=Q976K5_SULTO|nr:glycosyltransferase family 4 protein [Sulfurisphaera tokodaii]BAB65142.1 putative glycosyltransferase [Sulfurisphaera tokodaii str. 7]HII74301.1 glycosyltransferase family 4 protein [Sulfurisphaera tokodaii]